LGSPLAEIRAHVWIFHGEQDLNVPPSPARRLAAELPNSRLELFPEAGHGLILADWREIVGDLQASRNQLAAPSSRCT
jgi:pimeloyl-ACP methyl ester carboxylesterase